MWIVHLLRSVTNLVAETNVLIHVQQFLRVYHKQHVEFILPLLQELWAAFVLKATQEMELLAVIK